MAFEESVKLIPSGLSSDGTTDIYRIETNEARTSALRAILSTISKFEKEVLDEENVGKVAPDKVEAVCKSYMSRYANQFQIMGMGAPEVVGWLTNEGWVFKTGDVAVMSVYSEDAPLCFTLCMRVWENKHNILMGVM